MDMKALKRCFYIGKISMVMIDEYKISFEHTSLLSLIVSIGMNPNPT